MPAHLRAILWLASLLAASALPVFLLLAEPVRHTGPWWAFALALGYAGIAVMGLQFLLTSRVRWVVRPLGLEALYQFHRWLALVAFALLTLHAAVVAWRQPALVGFDGWPPLHVTAGIAGWLGYGVLVVTSLWGRQFGIGYRAWRQLHAGGAALAFGAGLWHAWESGRFVDTPGKRLVFAASVAAWFLLLAWVRVLRPALLARRAGRQVAGCSGSGRAIT
ncbi:MAG: ferric reductase-like transmembrane domain-containing protein [Steroidobacteraceae bacterium]|jgi:predicted ferric reductase|nr:ferric reductase-like transmembrane domain-containing protein [Steroidobacteraceae bacterium]